MQINTACKGLFKGILSGLIKCIQLALNKCYSVSDTYLNAQNRTVNNWIPLNFYFLMREEDPLECFIEISVFMIFDGWGSENKTILRWLDLPPAAVNES